MFVQHANPVATSTTGSVSQPAAPTAKNLLVWAIGADKSTRNAALTDGTWFNPINLPSTSSAAGRNRSSNWPCRTR